MFPIDYKVSLYALKHMANIATLEVVKQVYQRYFMSVAQRGNKFWSALADAFEIFKLKKTRHIHFCVTPANMQNNVTKKKL